MILRNLFQNKFPDKKPKKDGWYHCTISFKFDEKPIKNNETINVYQSYVMDLWWNSSTQSFIDNRIKNIIGSYDIMGYNNDIVKHKLSYEDFKSRIDRTENVVAWKSLPMPYKIKGQLLVNTKGEKENEWNTYKRAGRFIKIKRKISR